MAGRGAWSTSGAGGTLEYDGVGGTRPGPYYMLAEGTGTRVGKGGWGSPDPNVRAVHGAVRAIQWALNREVNANLDITGVFNNPTRDAVMTWQRGLPASYGTSVWGGIGQNSAKYLFMPLLRELVIRIDWTIVCGLIQSESGWDPGAVGYYDPEDLGLAQINGPAHPDWDEKERLRPTLAFEFVQDRLLNSIDYFSGDLRTAIASYNLGHAGATTWKRAGSPDMWTPAGSSRPRCVKCYIDSILTACST